MKDVYLLSYAVKGIKSIDRFARFEFYKKTNDNMEDTHQYNIKGIYGANGVGKTGIIASVEILRNALRDSGYLNNPYAQKNLLAITNKKLGELSFELDFVTKSSKESRKEKQVLHYEVGFSKDEKQKFFISSEKLSELKKTNNSVIYSIENGTIKEFDKKKIPDEERVKERTNNLLKTATLCSLYADILFEKMRSGNVDYSMVSRELLSLGYFGTKLNVYLDQSDQHVEYLRRVTENEMMPGVDSEKDKFLSWLGFFHSCNVDMINYSANPVPKNYFERFTSEIDKLCKFIHVFKADLQKIEIDKKENHDIYICDLIMVYESYRVSAEFESTGIKKLIKLFSYLQKMANGEIVFIDEFDSNLHDVYLCALLEYLMEFGEGQLCFTTHNVGPMDVLKKNKKSIDFISTSHEVYSWVKDGNYSPSKLYKNGMIEGSPFNVDSIDFLGILGSLGEEA